MPLGAVGEETIWKAAVVSCRGDSSRIKGPVEIGGTNVADYGPMAVARFVAVTGQDSVLFNITIRENLLLAKPDARDEQLIASCDAAQFGDLLRGLPKQLDTVIGERGLRLSGGQRQRLVIGRMVLLNRQVVLMDEATSQLDEPTETKIHEAILSQFANKTIIIAAHRFTAMRHAEHVFVLQAGLIVADGTHQWLRDSSPVYRELFHKDK